MRIGVPRRGVTLAALALMIAGTAACGSIGNTGPDGRVPTDDWTGPATDAVADLVTPRCTDRDHDGFGVSCARGPDCNDADPQVTDQCYRCARPATECPCTTEGARRPCDTVTDGDSVGPDGMCHMGERECRGGRWTRCAEVITGRPQRIIVPPASCGTICHPECHDTIVCPTDPAELTMPMRGVNVSISTAAAPAWCPGMPSTGGVELTGTTPPTASCAGVPGVCQVLPYGASGAPVPVTITTQVRVIDVYFLVDTTSYMASERSALQNALTTPPAGCGAAGLIDCLRGILPEAQFGVGYHDDFDPSPYGTYGCGGGGDFAYRHLLDITSSTASVNAAISSLTGHCGNDGPDSQVPALFALATGSGYLSYLEPRATSAFGACPAGYRGYPCFRPTSMPVVLLFTNSAFHNGPGNAYQYNDSTLWPPVAFVTYNPAVAVSGNESIGSAVTIAPAQLPYQASGTTSGMAHEHTPSCSWSSSAPDAIFEFTPTVTGTYQIDTRGSTYDTILMLRDSSNTAIACNDDYYGNQSRIVRTLTAMTTYRIWVDGYAGQSGAYVLRVAELPTATAPPASPTFTEAVDALNAIGAKVIVFQSCGDAADPWCIEGVDHANALANGTGTTISGGAPAVYTLPSVATGLADTVVTAVNDLATYSRMDVTAVALDNPATPGVDERCFVLNPAGSAPGTLRLSNTALGEAAPYPAGRCVDPPGSVGGVPTTANQCLAGTNVAFRLELANNCVTPTAVVQTFTFDVVTYGNGSYELSRTPVTVVVPAGPTYPPSGTFTYEVDARTVCGVGQIPDWTTLQFTASTPTDTSIQVTATAADQPANLGANPSVVLGTIPPATSPLPLGAALRTGMVPNNLPVLRLVFSLNGSPSGLSTPWLGGFRVLFDCVDGR